jgi:hypothetical protein
VGQDDENPRGTRRAGRSACGNVTRSLGRVSEGDPEISLLGAGAHLAPFELHDPEFLVGQSTGCAAMTLEPGPE